MDASPVVANLPNLPPALLRELELAAASAREQVLDTHLKYVLEFVDHASSAVAPPQALSIYTRLHRVPPGDGLLLAHRMLVALGERASSAPQGFPRLEPVAEEVVWTGPRSLWARLRKRLRGRVDPELRRWVEVHTGRAEVALLEVHVRNAMRFVELLVPATMPYAEAVDVYARMLSVPESKHETLYLMTLARVGERLALPAGDPAAAGDTTPSTALRIIETRAG